MDFFNKTKGAVSIFLVIILVPMLTVSGIIVDSSRLRLGKAMADSAGDLTLNTALTNYDWVLKDIYGLFAMSQTEEDLTKNLEEYFKKSIMASCVPEDVADSYTQQIMNSLRTRFLGDDPDKDFSDFMQIDYSNFKAEKIENSGLNNAGILKKQIVEFSKYRAPISMGLGFIQSLKSFRDIQKKNEVINKKTKYYDQQSKVSELCLELYEKIENYLDIRQNLDGEGIGITNEYLEALHKILNDTTTGPNESYKEFNRKLVMYLNDNSLKVDPPKYTIEGSGGEYYVDGKGTADFIPGFLEWEGALKSTFNNRVNNLNNLEPLLSDMYDNSVNELYAIQFVRQYSEYEDQIKDLHTIFCKYRNRVEGIYEKEESESDEEGEEEDEEIEEAPSVDIESTPEYQAYVKIMDNAVKINQKAKEAYNKIRIDIKKDANKMDSDLYNLATLVSAYYSIIYQADRALNSAVNKADELIKEITKLEAAKKNWGDAINSCPKGDEFTDGAKAEFDNVSELFTKEQVQELANRLDEIKGVLDNALPEIGKYSYGNKSIREIKSLNDLRKAVKIKTSSSYPNRTVSKPPIVESELEDFQKDIFDANYVAGNFDGINIININFLEFPPEFYVYLKKVYGDLEEDEEKKEDFNEATNAVASGSKDEVEVVAEGNLSTSFVFDKEGLNLPSGSAGGLVQGNTNIGTNDDPDSLEDDGAKNALADNGGFINSLFSNFDDYINEAATTFRDNIYVTEYVLKMFSYDTFENEIRYKTTSIKNRDSLAAMQSENGNPLTEEQKKLAVTMTTVPINEENNAAYGAEVEYIIFGIEEANKNVTAAYASVFGIRFVLNTIYAFTDTEIRNTALAMATPISLATAGIIPVSLIQAVIQIGLALAETAYDLLQLKEGMPVPIYKNKDTWVMKPSSILTEFKDAVVGEVISKTKDAAKSLVDESANYLQELMDKTDEELSNLKDEELDKLRDSLNSAFTSILETATGGIINMAVDACRQAVDEANASAGNALDKVDEIRANLEEKINASIAKETRPELKEAKEMARDIILDKSAGYIENLISEMQNKANKSLEEVEKSLLKLTSSISKTITASIIENIDSLFNKYKDEAINKIKDSIKNGQTALKNSIDEAFGKFGNSESGKITAGNPATSIFSFKYSDYLRLFLFIGLYINNGEGVIKRIADVIQVNLSQKMKHPVGDKFLMSKAYTYARISADIEVKPLLITVPLIADTIKNDATNTNWYKFKYSGIRGY